MSSVSSTSSSSTSTGLNRVTGLASGMEVDELVEALSLSTQSKINKINQNIQKNEWKTDAYRELISKFTSFSDKYLSLTSKDNMRMSSNYSAYSVKAKGSASEYMTVSTSTASGANAASNMVIRGVSSVASAAHYSSGAVTNDTFTATDAISATYNTNNIKGQTIGFKINDGSSVTYTFTSEDIAGAVDELNEKFKDSGITAEYKDGNFSITADGDNKLSFTGVSDKIKDIFGITTSTTVDSSNEYSAAADESKVTTNNIVGQTINGKSITFSYNGISKKIAINLDSSKDWENATAEEVSVAVKESLQTGLDKAFGAGRVTAEVSPDNKLSFSTSLSTSTLSITGADSEVTTGLGLKTGTSNRVSLSGKSISDIDFKTPLEAKDEYKLTVNDVELTFSKDATVSEIMSKINSSGAGVTVSYSQTSNSFSFVANETGSQGRIDIKDVDGNLAKSLFNFDDTTAVEQGKDTVMDVSFDGGNTFQTVTRSTASVNLDGVSMTFDKEIESADFTKPISFTANNDTDKIVDKIKTMINEYNEIIKSVNDAVKTRPDSNYEPLTDAQKEEMTDEQIEKWEEKAKKGILYGDSEIRSLTYDLSSAVTNVVSGVGLPSSIGISLSSDYTKGGIIEIDEDKLRAAVNEDPDKVISMFTNDTETSTGLVERINDVVDKYVGTSIKSDTYSRSRGILVNKAGIKDHISETDNQLNDQLKSLKSELEKMQTKLDAQRERLYNKFSYLESFVNQQNSVASWLTSQMGY